MVAIGNLTLASMLVDFAKDAQVRPVQARGSEIALVAAAQASEHRRRETPAVKVAKDAGGANLLDGVGAIQGIAAFLKNEIANEIKDELDQTGQSQDTGSSRRSDSAVASEEKRFAGDVSLAPALFAQTFARNLDGI